MRARQVLMDGIDSKNEVIAQKAAIEFLKRRDPRYSDRIEGNVDLDAKMEVDINLSAKTMMELEDMRKKFL